MVIKEKDLSIIKTSFSGNTHDLNETYSEISIPLKEISTVKYDLSSNLHKGFVNPVLFIIDYLLSLLLVF